MKKLTILLFSILISFSSNASDYYKCTTEKAYVVTDNGIMDEHWVNSGTFTIDRVTGEYRSIGMDVKFNVIDKGDNKTSFKAIYDGGWNHFPYMLTVQEFSDSTKKPFILMAAESILNIRTGLCEKF